MPKPTYILSLFGVVAITGNAYNVTVVRETWGPSSCNTYERPMFLPGCSQRADMTVAPEFVPYEDRSCVNNELVINSTMCSESTGDQIYAFGQCQSAVEVDSGPTVIRKMICQQYEATNLVQVWYYPNYNNCTGLSFAYGVYEKDVCYKSPLDNRFYLLSDWGFMSFPDTVQQCTNFSIAQNRSIGPVASGLGVNKICLQDVGNPTLMSYQFFSLATSAPTPVPTNVPTTNGTVHVNTTAPTANGNTLQISIIVLFVTMFVVSFMSLGGM